MLIYPEIDPVALRLGSIQVHWYGLSYVVGILCAWWLARRCAPRLHPEWAPEFVDDMIFYASMGVVFGGRIGYMLFYNLPVFLADPTVIFKVWQGGMSFHGGLLGVFTALWWLGRSHKVGFITLTDFIGPLVPIGLFSGRLGNFVNGELWGAPTDLPWGMVFPDAGPLPRHPSQLYEAGLEGLLLFVVLWWFARRPRPEGAISSLFMLGYGLCRFMVEFVREPDRHIGYLAFDWLTMGQVLTLPMIAIGIGGLCWAYRRAPGG